MAAIAIYTVNLSLLAISLDGLRPGDNAACTDNSTTNLTGTYSRPSQTNSFLRRSSWLTSGNQPYKGQGSAAKMGLGEDGQETRRGTENKEQWRGHPSRAKIHELH